SGFRALPAAFWPLAVSSRFHERPRERRGDGSGPYALRLCRAAARPASRPTKKIGRLPRRAVEDRARQHGRLMPDGPFITPDEERLQRMLREASGSPEAAGAMLIQRLEALEAAVAAIEAMAAEAEAAAAAAPDAPRAEG